MAQHEPGVEDEERMLRLQLHPDLRTLLTNEEKKLMKRLERERRQREEWAARQERLLRETVEQQRRVEQKINAFRDVAARQQECVDDIVDGLRLLVEGAPVSGAPAAIADSDPPAFAADDTQAAAGLTRTETGTSSNFAEPKKGCLWSDGTQTAFGRCVTHPAFEAVSALVIFANAVFIGYASQYEMDRLFVPIGQASSDAESVPGEGATGFIKDLELFFFVFYSLELVLKLAVFRLTYFSNHDRVWNIFDVILVLVAGYDVAAAGSDAGGGINLTWMRLLRLLKVLRMLRVVRVLKFFRELRLMLHSIVGASRSLFWSLVMAAIILYIFGLCFLQGATTWLIDNKDDLSDTATQEGLEEYWSSVGGAMLSLFMAVTGGIDWGLIAAPIKATGGVYYAFFLFFIAFINFAILNLFTGIFVDQAMQIAAVDRDAVIQEERERGESYINDVRRLFRSLDAEGTGHIAWDKFEEHLEDDEMVTYFTALDLDVIEARGLFKMLDLAGDNTVDIEDFIDGCIKLKGQAKSIDMLTLMYDTKKYVSQLGLFMTYCEEMFSDMHRYFERLGAGKSKVQPLSARLHKHRCPVQH